MKKKKKTKIRIKNSNNNNFPIFVSSRGHMFAPSGNFPIFVSYLGNNTITHVCEFTLFLHEW